MILRHPHTMDNSSSAKGIFPQKRGKINLAKGRNFPGNFVDFFRKPSIINSCMDIMNATSPEVPPSLRELETEQKVVGVKQLKKALRDGRAKRVFLAKDADPQITESVSQLCSQYGTPCVWVATMASLGDACGIDVGAAAAAVLNP